MDTRNDLVRGKRILASEQIGCPIRQSFPKCLADGRQDQELLHFSTFNAGAVWPD
jgi:hypothetical protein